MSIGVIYGSTVFEAGHTEMYRAWQGIPRAMQRSDCTSPILLRHLQGPMLAKLPNIR